MAEPLPERPGWGPQPMLFDTKEAAWAHARANPGSPYPFALGDQWAIPVPPPKVQPVQPAGMTMAEFLALNGPVKAPPSPRSAAKAAQLHAEDRPRITQRVARAAERKRQEAEREARRAQEAAAEQRRREQQGSLFDTGTGG